MKVQHEPQERLSCIILKCHCVQFSKVLESFKSNLQIVYQKFVFMPAYVADSFLHTRAFLLSLASGVRDKHYTFVLRIVMENKTQIYNSYGLRGKLIYIHTQIYKHSLLICESDSSTTDILNEYTTLSFFYSFFSCFIFNPRNKI